MGNGREGKRESRCAVVSEMRGGDESRLRWGGGWGEVRGGRGRDSAQYGEERGEEERRSVVVPRLNPLACLQLSPSHLPFQLSPRFFLPQAAKESELP